MPKPNHRQVRLRRKVTDSTMTVGKTVQHESPAVTSCMKGLLVHKGPRFGTFCRRLRLLYECLWPIKREQRVESIHHHVKSQEVDLLTNPFSRCVVRSKQFYAKVYFRVMTRVQSHRHAASSAVGSSEWTRKSPPRLNVNSFSFSHTHTHTHARSLSDPTSGQHKLASAGDASPWQPRPSLSTEKRGVEFWVWKPLFECVCVWMCVCTSQPDSEREREREGDTAALGSFVICIWYRK